MPIELELAPKSKRPVGQARCAPTVLPAVDAAAADRIAALAKVLSDPIRVQIVDVLREHAGEVCVCDLEPLFDVSQPTLSHHLRKLRDAGVVDSTKQGLWTYYFVLPDALRELDRWLSPQS